MDDNGAVGKQHQHVGLGHLRALAHYVDVTVDEVVAEDGGEPLGDEVLGERAAVGEGCVLVGLVRGHPVERRVVEGLDHAVRLQRDVSAIG